MQQFYITTKDNVDRILMATEEGLFLGEMKPVHQEETPSDGIYWNGEVPIAYTHIGLIFLGGEGTTEYSFDGLFSEPFIELFSSALSNVKSDDFWHNMAIINTPAAIKLVILEVPKPWQDFFKLAPLEIFQSVPLDKLKLEVPSGTAEDYLALGIDPTLCNWIRTFDLKKPPAEYIELIGGKSGARGLLKYLFKIHCYLSTLRARYIFGKPNKLEVLGYTDTLF